MKRTEVLKVCLMPWVHSSQQKCSPNKSIKYLSPNYHGTKKQKWRIKKFYWNRRNKSPNPVFMYTSPKGQDTLHFKLHGYILGWSFCQKDLQRGDVHILLAKFNISEKLVLSVRFKKKKIWMFVHFTLKLKHLC